uniref:AlNc14C403G11398 protein n=1 Tax=Albugo laibachii Nc14 TaxID=890382 RepID=F0WYY7_9STRA|nr:AlNc14C403G11398 [Albugo laibachii Nc14]|eukprot:CCA26701.1 AlNc14C403G11398 [Albugo laibachii Nc14]
MVFIRGVHTCIVAIRLSRSQVDSLYLLFGFFGIKRTPKASTIRIRCCSQQCVISSFLFAGYKVTQAAMIDLFGLILLYRNDFMCEDGFSHYFMELQNDP